MSTSHFDEQMLDVRHIQAVINGHEVVAGVQPLCGANLVSLRVDGLEYLHYDAAALRSPEEMYTGCFVMFPTPCKLPDGKYEFQGQAVRQRKAGRVYSMHGLVRDEAFDFAPIDGGMHLELEVTPDHPVHEAFPFPGLLGITLKLVERGLEYSFSFENRGDSPAPVGFGLHPFWRIPSQRRDVYIQVPCERVMLLEDLLPTGMTESVAGTELDLRRPRCLEGLEMDSVFIGRDVHKPAVIEYRDLGKRMTLRADEVFSHQIVYAPAGKSFVCVENLTCAPNAANLQSVPQEVSGFRVVKPGESLSGTTRFIVEDL